MIHLTSDNPAQLSFSAPLRGFNGGQPNQYCHPITAFGSITTTGQIYIASLNSLH